MKIEIKFPLATEVYRKSDLISWLLDKQSNDGVPSYEIILIQIWPQQKEVYEVQYQLQADTLWYSEGLLIGRKESISLYDRIKAHLSDTKSLREEIRDFK